MAKPGTKQANKHRELMEAMGYGPCTVSAPLEDHRTLKAFGALLKENDETAKGILASIAAMADGRKYKPYLTPETEAYQPPEVAIEPAILNVLDKIAKELGGMKDIEQVARLERQVQISIDVHNAKASNKTQRTMR